MTKVLILFSTTDGHTYDICKKIESVLTSIGGIEVDLISLKSNADILLDKYDKVVIGASIRYGKHNPEVYGFIERNLEALEKVDNAFFSVNVVARKSEKNSPQTNPYMIKFLKEIKWTPKSLAVFAGRLDYPKYSFWDRTMIRLIMWMTKGPVAPDTVVEYTNWDKVEEFALQLIQTEKEIKVN